MRALWQQFSATCASERKSYLTSDNWLWRFTSKFLKAFSDLDRLLLNNWTFSGWVLGVATSNLMTPQQLPNHKLRNVNKMWLSSFFNCWLKVGEEHTLKDLLLHLPFLASSENICSFFFYWWFYLQETRRSNRGLCVSRQTEAFDRLSGLSPTFWKYEDMQKWFSKITDHEKGLIDGCTKVRSCQ